MLSLASKHLCAKDSYGLRVCSVKSPIKGCLQCIAVKNVIIPAVSMKRD